VLAETQTALLPLIPYLDTLRWVFIAVALGGIAVTIYARWTTGNGGGDDRRARLVDPGHALGPAALARWGAVALAVLLFLLSLGGRGRSAGRMAERLETLEVNEIQRRMLEAAARRPRSRDELAERLRDGRF
jgi:hypothetical protein